MTKAIPKNKKAATMSINAGLPPASVTVVGDADSVTTMTGATSAGAASAGATRVGDRGGSVLSAASATIGGSALAAPVDASEAGGTEAAVAVGGCELFTRDARVGVAVTAVGLVVLLDEVGCGVIVAPVAGWGVASTRVGNVVGLTTFVAGCVVGVAVGVGVKTSVIEIRP